MGVGRGEASRWDYAVISTNAIGKIKPILGKGDQKLGGREKESEAKPKSAMIESGQGGKPVGKGIDYEDEFI